MDLQKRGYSNLGYTSFDYKIGLPIGNMLEAIDILLKPHFSFGLLLETVLPALWGLNPL